MTVKNVGLLVICTLLLPACQVAPIKVWEKGDLARADMRWQPDPLQHSLRTHIHTAKEAAAGGIGVSGGGCGCY